MVFPARVGMLLCSSLALAACEDDPKFISIESLCTQLAVDVCEARIGACCPAETDTMACQDGVEARCKALRANFEAEAAPDRTYESERAAAQSDALRAELAALNPPCQLKPLLARFYTSGLVLGAACERDTQCESGVCAGEPKQCSDAPLVSLCTQ